MFVIKVCSDEDRQAYEVASYRISYQPNPIAVYGYSDLSTDPPEIQISVYEGRIVYIENSSGKTVDTVRPLAQEISEKEQPI